MVLLEDQLISHRVHTSLQNMVSLHPLPLFNSDNHVTNVMQGVIGLTKSVSPPYPLLLMAVKLTHTQDAIIYAPHGIRINALCPGYVNTPLLQKSAERGEMDTEIAKIPMKRLADVDEVSDCIVFLASPMASYMTGSSLLADGGYTAN
jgi:Enoyl-(Acyl carrier protein) reductase